MAHPQEISCSLRRNSKIMLQNSTWLLAVFLVAVFALFRWLVQPRRSDEGKKPPGPFGLPWIGYLPWIDGKAPYETFTKLAHKYGPVYSLKLGGLETVFVSDPVLIRQAFSRDVFTGRAPLYLTHGIMKGQGMKPPSIQILLQP